ncbi:AAA family ATPase [Priestia megaterium]|uniref:ATP-dependent nuclease n=1 Tax=Priestia megaterium TaxID=1404 RepID=UPI00244A6457|nr:AAA family ATPase [Priestia megaterium]MDH2364158.1 AAA family ATPase [Priestia megaterium]
MRLKKFSVTNYKVFDKTFSVDFATDSIVILTGRNNTGKSTILEAINCFFTKETKATTIPGDCYSNRNSKIVLEAHFDCNGESLIFTKHYQDGQAPKYYADDKEIKATHPLREKFDEIINNKPYYITPYMSSDDINNLIQTIYSQIIKSDLQKLEEELNQQDQEESVSESRNRIREEYAQIKKALPTFLRKLKSSTDSLLNQVSQDVSKDLQDLFSNDELSLRVIGGESDGFSTNDIIKSTNSSVYIDNKRNKEMPLSNQGTGLQRMSLIYLIQNMIQNKIMGETDDKLLLIDEPEAFLHPEAVRALSRSLYKIGAQMPLMISTHSPILIDLSEKHTSIQVLRVVNEEAIQLYKSKTDQFTEDDRKNMKILNYVDSYVNEFFFAKKIIIVEGDTEYIAFKHLAKNNNENIHIIRARGKATICTLMKILNQFNTEYYVLHDVDNDNNYALKTLKAQLTNCKNILDLKTKDSIEIYASISTFEVALGIGSLPNHKKTQVIHDIIHEITDDAPLITAQQEVKNLFNYIVKRNNRAELGYGFRKIDNKQDYEDLFLGLIKQKELEEQQNDEVEV